MNLFNFYHLVVLIYVLIFTLTDLSYLNIIFLLFCIIYFLTQKPNESIYSILMLIPLMDILIFKGIPLINILMVYAFILYIAKMKISIDKNKQWLFVFLSVFILYDLVHYILLPFNGYIQISEIITWSISFLFFIILTCMEKEDFSNENAQKYFIIGTGYSIAYGLIKRYQEIGLSDLLVMNNTVDRIMGASGDPNYYSLYILLSIIFLMYFLKMYKNKFQWFFIIMIIIYYVAGLLSLSRMYLIVSVMILVLLLPIIVKSVMLNKSTNKIKMLIYITFITIIFIPIFKDMINANITTIYSRLQLDNVEDLTSNRNIIFSQYLDYSFDNIFHMLFGIGIIKYNIRSEVIAFAHNLYIELLVAWGLLGILYLIIILLFIGFKYACNNKRINNLRVIPLFILLVCGISLNILEIEVFYLLVFLCFSILKEPKEILDK